MSRRSTSDVDPFDPTAFVQIEDAAPTTAAESLLAYELGPGAMVGDYRIEGKIGEGGMGVVFAAVHPLIGKRAAIKVLQRELCTDRTALARFVDEARVVNKIGHPNIVDIFTLGQLPDGRSYLVMEWLSGETLRTRLARVRPDLDETCYILRSLTRALEAVHEKGVVHRDLKPDNVFLVAVRGDRPMVKLLDFGIAKLVHTEHRIERTASNQMIGTPLYMSPEQARAEPIDHRADIYALGAMAFEMVVGRPPFDGKSAMEVIAKHMMEPAVRPSARLQGLPADLDDIVYAMLAKDPAHRPTLADFAAILDRLASAMQLEVPKLRGGMPVIDRVAPTINPGGPGSTGVDASGATLGDRPAVGGRAQTPPVAPVVTMHAPIGMTAGPAIGHTAPAAPAVATTTVSPAPVQRRWLLPLVGGVCLAGGIGIAVLVMGGRAPMPAEPTLEAKPTNEVKPEPTKTEPAKVEETVETKSEAAPASAEAPATSDPATAAAKTNTEPSKIDAPAKTEPAKIEPAKTETSGIKATQDLLEPGTGKRIFVRTKPAAKPTTSRPSPKDRLMEPTKPKQPPPDDDELLMKPGSIPRSSK